MKTCEHKKQHTLQSWKVTGNDITLSHGQITICLDCALITVQSSVNGVSFYREFRTYDDESLAAIHRFRKNAGIEK